MKKLLFGLFMFCFSFEAYAIKVEDMYKLCKPYHTSEYKIEDMNATICRAYIKGLIDAGGAVCDSISFYLCDENNKSCNYDGVGTLKKYLTHDHKLKHANNRYAKINDVIQSFIHYVEKYFKKWDSAKKYRFQNVSSIKTYFLHREFPYKKYPY